MEVRSNSEGPRLNKERHVKYWKRCLKTYLPSAYTSNDSNRMYLGYFIISALELLNELDSSLNKDERYGYAEWIYHCQHPKGGFRMWPGTDFNDRATSENAGWDPAHVPATYFALTTLVTLGDRLERVRLMPTLRWLQTMQREDGSFGETMINGRIEGGRDPRYGYCAAAIRKILHQLMPPEALHIIGDIDVAALQRAVVAGQAYDGGIADAAGHEPQAGYTFCALGTLDLLGTLLSSALDIPAVVKWLVDRQTDVLGPENEPDRVLETHTSQACDDFSGILQLNQKAETVSTGPDVRAAGMNGRPNKIADTCYAWWVEASLHMLGHASLYHRPAVRSYLMTLTQHPYMGGFTKVPDEKYADIYHSFMGLAAVSLASTDAERAADGIVAWDATMCVSREVRGVLAEMQFAPRD